MLRESSGLLGALNLRARSDVVSHALLADLVFKLTTTIIGSGEAVRLEKRHVSAR